MRVAALHLHNFRSYAQAQAEFGPGVTTLIGPNGQGKTNVVEAVRYLSTLSSHRVATDAPLIRAGSQAATIQARVDKAGRTLAVEVTINAGGTSNQARIGTSSVRPRELLGILRTVVFAPEDLELVKGDPATRRRLLDELCVALQPTTAGDITDYDRVLRQRVSMLKTAKSARGDLTMLDIWDEKLAYLGGRIVAARLRAVESLSPWVERAYADVAPQQGQCVISYSSSIPASDASATAEDLAAAMLDALRDKRTQEIERGVTLTGPHRDDLTIMLGALPAKGYASHGESWSCALALRLGTYDLLTHDDGPDAEPDGEPVLILDDVFAELDARRRAALAARLVSASQVLITAAVEDDVPGDLRGGVLRVGEGTLTGAEAS